MNKDPVEKYTHIWMKNSQPNTHVKPPQLQDYFYDRRSQVTSIGDGVSQLAQELADRSDLMMRSRAAHTQRHRQTISDNSRVFNEHLKAVNNSWQQYPTLPELANAWQAYLTDSSLRWLQTADVLRQRGDIFIEHEAAGCPPVLDYDYEVVIDGADLSRPCNYVLLKILPPDGIEVSDTRRPYIIIDPRAGHGGGIGGFKHDSQVGVAFKDGHPVYFIAFKRMPEPGQTIADITHAEATFVREVQRRHPNANPSVVVGNCQGGWATLVLAATHADITGPIVLNGAPICAWSGEVGINPMRYKGGVQGSTWLAMLTADMGNGVFDGSWLVQNFELLNPSRNFIGKYYDLYKNPQKNQDRFLEFERWWGGFFMMNGEEIRWIVENIFIGNKISRNTAQLETGTHIDIKNIKAPIVVFASHGDNITPPPQALNWILDTYTDEREIEVCGQRIVYMVHEQVGHLGIFVSSSIANREHKGVASILKMIEALPPGLYELVLEDYEGRGDDMKFYVTFKRRTTADLAAIDDGRMDEKPFKAVARVSAAQARAYETFVRPVVRAFSSETQAQWLRATHPMRLQRSLWSSHNPVAAWLSNLSQTLSSSQSSIQQAQPHSQAVQPSETQVQTQTHTQTQTEVQRQQETLQGTNATATLTAIEPLRQDNPFLLIEKLWIDSITTSLDLWRDWQAMTQELFFYGMWTLPWLRAYGRKEYSRRLHSQDSVSQLPMVEKSLAKISKGGFVEAVVRMLIISKMMTQSGINRDKLMLVTEIMTQSEPFSQLEHQQLAAVLHEQTIIVRFDPDNAIATLPTLLAEDSERELASQVVRYVAGRYGDMPLETRKNLDRIHEVLGLTDSDDDVLSNPLQVRCTA